MYIWERSCIFFVNREREREIMHWKGDMERERSYGVGPAPGSPCMSMRRRRGKAHMAAHAAPPQLATSCELWSENVDSLARMLCCLPSQAPIRIHHAYMHACMFSDLCYLSAVAHACKHVQLAEFQNLAASYTCMPMPRLKLTYVWHELAR